jgi:hypothetical protein
MQVFFAPNQLRTAAYVGVLLVIVGAVAGLSGMLLYPGGTWFDPKASGYDFWLNFLCDSMHRVALNGKPNQLGGLLSQASLVILMLGLLPLWLTVPCLFRERALLGRVIRACGCVATLAMLMVPLTPSDRFGTLHGVAVSIAGPLGLGSVLAILLGLWSVRHSQRPLLALTFVVILLSLLDLVLYARSTWFGAPLTPLLPIVQKLAFLCSLLWMLVAAREVVLRASQATRA